jgi:ubiquinone/menaquinone biosynthesis C-methylase UbiE
MVVRCRARIDPIICLRSGDEAHGGLIVNSPTVSGRSEGHALCEMHRVLKPGVRLALALWCSIETSPGHHALAQGIARHVSQDVASLMGNAFSLGEAEAISTLLEVAGFREKHIRQEERMAKFPSPNNFAT